MSLDPPAPVLAPGKEEEEAMIGVSVPVRARPGKQSPSQVVLIGGTFM